MSMNFKPVLPALLFRDLLRERMDAAGPVKCAPWDKAATGRQVRFEFFDIGYCSQQ
jgi:hypothetical protein